MQVDDNTLARSAARGDRSAFATLLERHYDRIYRLAWRWVGRRDVAEDVAQEVCLKLATAIRSFRADATFSTWAYRIAYNAAIDHVRAQRRTEPTEAGEIERLVDQAGAARSPEAAVLDGELWDAVRALPAQQRDAVLLVYGEDMSHAEAAELMGCTEKTVSWHLHEARKRLKGALALAS